MTSTELRAEDIRWDLTDLCSSAEEARTQWSALVRRAQELAGRYRGKIASLDPSAFRELLDETDDLEQDLSRLQVYSYLRLSMAATEVEANDLATFSRDRGAEIENALVFIGLEWIALDDDQADAILSSPESEPYEHKLRVERYEKPYVLSELEEQALNARRPTVSAWRPCTTGTSRRSRCRSTPGRVSSRTRSASCSRTSTGRTATSVCAPSPRCTKGWSRASTCSPLRTTRSSATGSAPTVCAGTRIRCSRRICRNELDDETVEAMMTATEEAYPIARKWFEAKARLLGLDRLELADQYAPIGEARPFAWPEAVEIVDSSFARFSPRLAEIFRACIEAGHVDVLPRPGKAAGAYCTSVSKTILPYVLMNYTDRLRDVSTLAHEFGHATHNVISLEQQT